MSTATSFSTSFGRILSVCLLVLITFATTVLGLTAFLINGADGSSPSLSTVTIVASCLTYCYAVPILLLPYFSPHCSLLQTKWVSLYLGIVFAYWFALSIAWVVVPTQHYLVFCQGDTFYFVTFATRCSILRAVQAFAWLSCVTNAGVLGLILTVAALSARRGQPEVWVLPVYDISSSRSKWTDLYEPSAHSATSPSTGARPGGKLDTPAVV